MTQAPDVIYFFIIKIYILICEKYIRSGACAYRPRLGW